jgi:small conductance mechanosensitive channel
MPPANPDVLHKLSEFGMKAIAAALILIGGWILSSWLARFVEERSEKSGKVDRTLSIILGKVTRASLLILTFVTVLSQLGVQTASLLAVLGTAGLAIGLALQGALSNVAAGVMLLVFRPFKIGDTVDFGSVAVVDEIGLFLSRMHTADNVAMVVPNSKIWGNVILNYAQNETRRLDMVFSIGYGDNIDLAIRLLHQAIAADPRFLKEPAPLVAVAELGESSVNLWVRPWVKRGDFMPAKLDFIKTVKQQFDANGISIPFPQRDVHLFTEAPASAAV